MKHSTKSVDLLVMTWHQVYMSAKAGGYVRLREFLKRMPKEIKYIVMDNPPSLYADILPQKNIVIFETPKFLKQLEKKLFVVWIFLETIFAGIVVYQTGKKLIENLSPKVIYVTIGEFPQLYIPAILLKRKYPHVRLVVYILNYELPEKNVWLFYKRLRNSGSGLFRTIAIISAFYIGYFLTNRTINNVDYVFTVSKKLVLALKKVYKKTTIDYTPSGVNLPLSKRVVEKKKFLGIYVGRMSSVKGVFEILNVWAKVVEQNKTAQLALVGFVDENTLGALKKQIEFNLKKNVSIFTDVSDQKKNELLSQSELFLHLAKYEPLFPVIGILEGFSFGLPVVIYNMEVYQSVRKQFKLTDTSIYAVKNSDTNAAAKAVTDFARLSQSKKKEASLNVIKIAKLFSWDSIAQKEFRVINSLIKQQK